MTEAELIAWFDDLLQRGRAVPALNNMYREIEAAGAWLAEAEAAIASGFPPGHAIRTRWADIFVRARNYLVGGLLISEHNAHMHFTQAIGVVAAALSLLRNGRLRGVLEGVQAATVVEVLAQADQLVAAGYTVAATVLAGGALETHLLHLCTRNALAWNGEGSLAKYDQAVAEARNAGTAVEVYGLADTRLIGGWSGLRNAAAHDPTNYVRPVAEVRLMIEGVRQFIARVP